MNIINLNEQNFDSTISQEGIVLVDCWAKWCSACKDFNPIFEKTAARRENHTFAKLDTTAEAGLVSELNIEHVPTLLLYRDGILLFQQPGYYEEEKLDDILNQAENLDMKQVRDHIEEEKRSLQENK
jgi:thioredoxin 1